MKPKVIRLGSRRSALALMQARLVADSIRSLNAHLEIEIKEIDTKGDIDLKSSFEHMNSRSVFTKELDEALLRNEIDIAVHSAKDLPSELDRDFCIAMVSHGEDVRDAWISPDGRSLEDLKPGERVGTSSIRRKAILTELFPHLVVCGLRGNVQTRLKKMHEENLSGIILAAAGLKRLELDSQIVTYLDTETFVPAAGQGVLATVCLSRCDEIKSVLSKLNDQDLWLRLTSERTFISAFDGGCRVPLTLHVDLRSDKAKLSMFLSSKDHKTILRKQVMAVREDVSPCVQELIQWAKQNNADKIIEEFRTL